MRTSSIAATLLAAMLLGGLLGGCGNQDAVKSSASLDDLGARVAQPATRTTQLIGGSSPDGKQVIEDDATEDRACSGGHRRVFKAKVTAALASGDDEARVRNRVSLAAQSTLKEAGVEVTADLGQDAGSVPATLEFTNEPSDAAEKRTYRTTVKVGADSYTWSITGRTACIAD